MLGVPTAMDEIHSNPRSLAQHKVQARRLCRRAIYEVLAVVVFSVGMYVLIREGMHIALKLICGLMIVSSAINGVTDYFDYKKRKETIREMEIHT